MDTEEVVDLILEAFHTTVSDDDYVNEQSVRASIWDLVEKYGDAIGASEADDLAQAEIRDLEKEIENLEDDLETANQTIETLQARLEEAEVQLA